jgi:TP901 family phage tail tape measure protein
VAVNFDAVLRLVAKVDGLQNVEKLQGALGSIEGTAKNARRAFTDVTSSATWQAAAVGAAAIGAGLVTSMRTAMDFEKAMSGVQAKVGGTSEEIAELNKLARDLGRTTQFSASQAAEGMDFLAMAGFKTNEIVAAMPGLLNLAAAGSLELGTAADIASNILGGMNMEASETGRVADVLAKAATSSNVSVEMLGETFKFVAPVAAQAGVGLEELAAATGLLGDAGIQGSEAGTGLRSVLLRLAAPPAEAAKALDKLGVSTKDSAGNMRPFGEILADVDRRMNELNLGTAEQLEIQNALYGKTAIASGAILQQAAATGKLDEKTRELMDAQGSAAKMAETMNDNLAGAFKRLMSAVEGFQIQLMSGSNPAVQGLIDGLAGAINVVTDLMERFPLLTTAVVALAAAFVALVAAAPFIAAFISVIGSLKAALAGVAMGATVAGWAGAVVPAIAAIKAAFLGLIGWFTATLLPGLLAFFSGPIGWTVLAVAAVVAMAIAFRKPIQQFFVWFAGAITDGIKALWAIGEPIRQFWAGVWEGVKGFATAYFQFLGGVATWGLKAVMAIAETLLVRPWVLLWNKVLRDPASAAFRWLTSTVSSGFKAVTTAIDNLFVKPWILIWSKLIREPVTAAQEWLRSSVFEPLGKAFVTYVTDPITNAWRAVTEFMPRAMQSVATFVSSVWNGMITGIQNAVRGMLTFVVNAVNRVGSLVNVLIDAFNRLAVAVGGSTIGRVPTLSVPAFAKGGTVDKPTLALVGEGGEREYIIPESKMQAASSRFLGGARGADVIPSAGATSNEPNVARPAQINITTGPVMQQQDGSRWVSIEDFERGLQDVAEQVVGTLRTPQARTALGWSY